MEGRGGGGERGWRGVGVEGRGGGGERFLNLKTKVLFNYSFTACNVKCYRIGSRKKNDQTRPN